MNEKWIPIEYVQTLERGCIEAVKSPLLEILKTSEEKLLSNFAS